MKNLEIKSKYKDHKYAVQAAKKIKAKYSGILQQTDTYFNVQSGLKSGRLKMRVINKKSYELIHYNRPDSKKARYSNYEIVCLKNGKQVYKLLNNSLGIKCVIVKKRILYIFENVRIHLDTVNRLGKFLEFEIVCNTKKDEKEAPGKMKFLKDVFHVDDKNILPYSYSDMLEVHSRESGNPNISSAS